jgi:hypothetical protein
MRKLLLVIAVFNLQIASAQKSGPFRTTEQIEGGFIVVTDLYFQKQERLSRSPYPDFLDIELTLTNKTPFNWASLHFKMTLEGYGSNVDSSISHTIYMRSDYITAGTSVNLVNRAMLEEPVFHVRRCVIDIVGGRRDPPPEELAKRKAEEKKALQKAAALKAASAAQQAAAEERRRMLAAAPKLHNGSDLVILGADRKCLQQAIDTGSMDGLEKRKRISELISYQCIFTAPDGTPVQIKSTEAKQREVVIIDGPLSGKSGWVLESWLRIPAPK